MHRQRQRAFTLVEAVVVIVIIGVLAGIVAVFIRAPVQGFVDSAGRAELSDVADLALRRMARDLRMALPNSVRVSTDGHAIEFLATVGGGRYVAADDGVDDPSALPLDFVGGSLAFTVANPMPDLTTWIRDARYVVVYNLGQRVEPSDAYFRFSAGKQHNIAGIDPVKKYELDAANLVTKIWLDHNPFSAQNPAMASPTHRFQLVSGPVMYSCESKGGQNVLLRAWNYKIDENMAATAPAGGSSAILATGVSDCAHLFRYDEDPAKGVVLQRNALVVISLALKARNTNDSPVRLVHQVHVDNTP